MARDRIVISEWMDHDAVDKLRVNYDVLYAPDLVEQIDAFYAALSDAGGLIVRNRTQVTAELLHAAPRLRVVGRLGVGLENIDLAACRIRTVAVCPAVGANGRSVAEYVLCSAMMLLRGIYQHSGEVVSGAWPRAALAQGREAMDKTMGIIGFGSIGKMTAELAEAAGFRVLYWGEANPAAAASHETGRCRPAASLNALLTQSDVVSLHVPIAPETRNLISATQLSIMKDGAILINAARGGVVDEVAVAAALRAGTLGGAAIDVFEDEPLKANSHWQGCPNLILTPHVAGLSRESNERVSHSVADAVHANLSN